MDTQNLFFIEIYNEAFVHEMAQVPLRGITAMMWTKPFAVAVQEQQLLLFNGVFALTYAMQ